MSVTPILYVHSADELYGSDIVLLELVRRLERTQYRPVVVTPTDIPYAGHLSQALVAAGVEHMAEDTPVLRRRYFSPLGALPFGRRLRTGTQRLVEVIEGSGCRLVHSNTAAVWGGALAARRSGVPHLWHIHEMVTRPLAVRKFIAWMVAHYSDRVVAISQAVAQHLLQDQPNLASRLSIIYDAVDTDQFNPGNDSSALRSAWQVQKDEVLVGVVGRISDWKGQQFFLDAFAQAWRQAPKLKAVIVGDTLPDETWRIDALKQQAAKAGIAERVIWAGYRQDIAIVMAAVDILVLPSVQPEPFGMVVLEAMASERPVIATAHGGPLETVIQDETGLLVSPTNPQEMASALATLANDRPRCHLMGVRGRLRVLDYFSYTQHVDAFQDLYAEMLQG